MVLAPLWGAACPSFDWRDMALLAAPPALVGAAQLAWLRSLGVLRPASGVPLLSPEAALHRLGAGLYIAYGTVSGLVAGLFSLECDFRVTPKGCAGGSGGAPLPPRLLLPLLAVSAASSLTLLAREAGAARGCAPLGAEQQRWGLGLWAGPPGYPWIALAHAGVYLAAAVAVVVLHSVERGARDRGAGAAPSAAAAASTSGAGVTARPLLLRSAGGQRLAATLAVPAALFVAACLGL